MNLDALRYKGARVYAAYWNKTQKAARVHMAYHQPYFVHMRCKQHFRAFAAFAQRYDVAKTVGAHFIRKRFEQFGYKIARNILPS
jgi:hypothetical protein